MDLIEEFIGLSEALHAAGVAYAVCGGVALAIHGHPRFTKDIVLLLEPKDLERALTAAAKRGFTLEGGRNTFGAGTPRERVMFRVSKADGAHLLTLDLLLSKPEHDAVWDSRRTVEFHGRRVGVVSREGLIQMKREAGRPQDLVDIGRLRGEDSGGPRD